MTFATQLAADFTPIAAVYDDNSTTRALTWAQSFIENYCLGANSPSGEPSFDLVTETVVIDPLPYRRALLPSVPVISVQTVQGLLPAPDPNMGLVLTSLTNFAFVAETGELYDTTGEPGVVWYFNVPSWPWMPGSLTVNYTHGFTVVPQGLIDVACRLAQQYLENPTLQLQRKVGEVEGRFAGSAGIVLGELDKMILDRHSEVGIT